MPGDIIDFRACNFLDEDDAVSRCLTPYLAMTTKFIELFDVLIEKINSEVCDDLDNPSKNKRSRNDYGPVDVRNFLDNVTPSSSRCSTPTTALERQSDFLDFDLIFTRD